MTPVALGVSIFCFLLVHLAPGDPLTAMMPVDATAAQQAEMRASLWLRQAAAHSIRHLAAGRVLHGDLGQSIASGRPALSELGRAVGNSLILASVATLIGFTLRHLLRLRRRLFPRQRAGQDRLRRSPCLGVSVPHYWLGIVMVIVFSATLGWLPPTGAGPDGSRQLAASTRSTCATSSCRPSPCRRSRWASSRVPCGAGRRHPRAGVRAGAARQGPGRVGCVQACRHQRGADGAGRDGAAAGLSARRLDPDRDGVRLAGHRLPTQHRDLPARPAAAAGHHPGAGDVLRGPQPRGRRAADHRSIRESSGAEP